LTHHSVKAVHAKLQGLPRGPRSKQDQGFRRIAGEWPQRSIAEPRPVFRLCQDGGGGGL